MTKTNIEILRTVTVTRQESAVVELDVPSGVLEDGDELSWIEEIMDKDDDGTLTDADRAVYAALTEAEWDVSDEDEDVEYDTAYEI